MKLILTACTLLLLTGCATYIQKRNVARMDSYAVQYPAEEARLANWLYPCFTGKAKSDTQVSFLKPDTTWVQKRQDTDSIHFKPGTDLTFRPTLIGGGPITFDGSIQRITTHEVKTIHDTVTDQRALSACTTAAKAKSDSLIVQTTNLAASNKNKSVWRWIALACIAVIVVRTVWSAYRFFTGGAVANTAGNILKKL